MYNISEIPDMYVYNCNRTINYGAISQCSDFTEDIRFGTASEISFKIPKKIYDSDSCEWVDNVTYDRLEKDNLIFIADDTDYFTFPNRTILADSEYKINNTDYSAGAEGRMELEYLINSDLSHFQIQKETMLYNICSYSGYNFERLSEINLTNGEYKTFSNWKNHFKFLACTDFIPINPYDVIAVRSRKRYGDYIPENGNLTPEVTFRYITVYFYEEADAATFVDRCTMGWNVTNPKGRISINQLIKNGSQILKEKMSNGGYIRVSVENGTDKNNIGNTNYPAYYYEDDTHEYMGWTKVPDGWIKVYSGEKRCIEVDNGVVDGTYNLKMRWFVIKDVDVDDDGVVPIKTISAQSYEITLSNRSVSLQEGTLPFFIPDVIVNTVNSDNWIIDKHYEKNSSNVRSLVTKKAAQYMQRGLLNQILDIVPDWSVGHISKKLMTRYRQIDEVDNIDIYTFLTDNVQKAYGCFFVFDNDNKKISAYTQEDIIQNSSVFLDWNNAIKYLKVNSSSVNRVTSLRVHTENDLYGLGLVNPFGGNTIYNFSEVLAQMDFVADDTNNDPWKRNQILSSDNTFVRYRTLKEAVIQMMNFSTNPQLTYAYAGFIKPFQNGIPMQSIDDYYNCAKNFIDVNNQLVKAKSRKRELLTQFKIVVDKINTLLADYHPNNYEDYLLSEIPNNTMLPTTQSSYSNYVNKSLYQEYRTACKNYWDNNAELGVVGIDVGGVSERCSLYTQYLLYYSALRQVSQRLNLNYKRQIELINKYPNGDITPPISASDYASVDVVSILTPKEILALQPFIVEGDWVNDNLVFSEDYSGEDIIDVLDQAKSQANYDLNNLYSKYNYDFELDMANFIKLTEMDEQSKRIRIGQTLHINVDTQKWISPILLEIHINYTDPSDFSMKFTTDYNRKVTSFRYADLYDSITKISVSNNQFTFDE